MTSTPAGQKAAGDLAASGASVAFLPGGASYYDAPNNRVVISRDAHPRDQAALLAHEAEHARAARAGETPNIDTAASADVYVDGMLREEARAQVQQIKVAGDLQRRAPLQAEYNDAYQKAYATAKAGNSDEAAARAAAEAAGYDRVLQGFRNGEVRTSTNSQTYPDYYRDSYNRRRATPTATPTATQTAPQGDR